jgi:ketosteroid isomerase-like protein
MSRTARRIQFSAIFALVIAMAWPAAAIGAVYAEDAILYPPGSGPVVGRKAITASFEPMLGAALSLKTVEVRQSGDYAIESGTWTFGGPDGRVADEGNYLVVWKRSGRDWLMWRDMWNSSRPPPKP